MRAHRDREHVVELLQRALLRLGQPEEDHAGGEHVHRGVEAEGALRREGGEQARQRDGDGRGPEVVRRDGPGHADFAVGEGEDFGGVGEGHRALAGAVEGVEDVDEEEDLRWVMGCLLVVVD